MAKIAGQAGPMSHGELFKVRVGVVVLDAKNRLLMARQNNRPFWVLPGGTLEKGESLGACAVREIKEEAGLDVALGPLLFVADFFAPDGRQIVDTVFFARLAGGRLEMEVGENLNELGFFSLDEVKTMPCQPQAVFERLLFMWSQGHWPATDAIYLGSYS